MDNKSKDVQVITQDAHIAIKRLKEVQFSEEWKQYSKKPCMMYTMKLNGRLASRGDSIVNFPIEQICAFLSDFSQIKKINSMIAKCEELERYSDNLQVLYQRFEGMGPVWGRDFVIALYKEKIQNKVYIAASSCKYECPQVKGFIRGEAYIGGYILEEIEENKTKVIFISDADIKGSIPSWIKKEVAKRQGSVAAKIENAMKQVKQKK